MLPLSTDYIWNVVMHVTVVLPCWLRSLLSISALHKVRLRSQWQKHQSAPHYSPKRPGLSAG